MTYNKQDAVMTRGFAILCMVVLHLFCRKGADVFGTPLIWIDKDTPFVYWFGFYAEICVSIYSICMGYAQYLLYINGKTTWRSTGKRIFKLMVNYWIILVLFSVMGLLYTSQSTIPGSLVDFLKSIVLLHSYNGAWWFLNTYIIFLLVPSLIKFFPVKKLSVTKGLVFCLIIQIGWYLFNRFGFWPTIPENKHLLVFISKELQNLIGILPSAWAGAFMCKGKAVQRIHEQYLIKVKNKSLRNCFLVCLWLLLFVSMNLIHKAAFTLIFAVFSFLVFNIWEKGATAQKVWLFLGKHSTNTWLAHMFFCTTLFTGLVQKAKYPIFMMTFMLVLCVVTSSVEMLIEKLIWRWGQPF